MAVPAAASVSPVHWIVLPATATAPEAELTQPAPAVMRGAVQPAGTTMLTAPLGDAAGRGGVGEGDRLAGGAVGDVRDARGQRAGAVGGVDVDRGAGRRSRSAHRRRSTSRLSSRCCARGAARGRGVAGDAAAAADGAVGDRGGGAAGECEPGPLDRVARDRDRAGGGADTARAGGDPRCGPAGGDDDVDRAAARCRRSRRCR